MEDEDDTVTRARLAEVWKVSLPTIDDWVRRGCPIHKEGDKGKACEFSLIAVKKWRVHDLAIRSGADFTELDRKGLEHGNGLRGLVQHAPEHFLRYAFRVGTHVFKEDLEELGLNDRQAKLGTLGIFLVLSYIYEQWLESDAFNEQVKHDLHEDLDSVFRSMGASWFKGQSLPANKLLRGGEGASGTTHRILRGATPGESFPGPARARKSARIDSARE